MASVRHSSADENSEREYQTIDSLIEDNLSVSCLNSWRFQPTVAAP